ncbi:HPr family phosphocarrier protein [Arthrobacter sp. 35W]|uniref:HPr family phosphocarrier protein n=1 Tax=Arthrobacter sp. 35W TaxID=1132441 RepID=UPI000423FE50|nr:HPr family phosphocarrier protein [Arthrobacter sp. 35W]
MYTRKATVGAAVGLHARPAAVFVRAVNQTGLPVTLAKGGCEAVDARSLLAVMTADFPFGCEVELAVDAAEVPAEEVRAALDALAQLVASELDG